MVNRLLMNFIQTVRNGTNSNKMSIIFGKHASLNNSAFVFRGGTIVADIKLQIPYFKFKA